MLPHPLDTLRVARPCPADWAAMRGDDRVRHCAACDLHVYNLSALTAAEAYALVQDTEGRRCVRFYRRADGTLLTQDCPEGTNALAHERAKGALVAFAVLSVWIAVAPFTASAWTLARQALGAATQAVGADTSGGGGWVGGEPLMGMMEVPYPSPEVLAE